MDGLAFANPGDVDPPDGQLDYGWRVLTSGPYAGHTARRLSIADGLMPLQVAFLRWKEDVDANGNAATSAAALQASMTFPGNLTAGFEEAQWPTSPAPDGYPALPGQLSDGDWIWGSPAYVQASNPVLDDHMANQRTLLLPIVDEQHGTGLNRRFRQQSVGSFLLLSYGSSRGVLYLELLALGAVPTENLCHPLP
jgi:hypothetical protein